MGNSVKTILKHIYLFFAIQFLKTYNFLIVMYLEFYNICHMIIFTFKETFKFVIHLKKKGNYINKLITL